MNRKKNGIYYTSDKLSKYMAKLLTKHIKNDEKFYKEDKKIRFLDPACGEGELLKAIIDNFNKADIELLGIDIDNVALQAAKIKLKENRNIKIKLVQEDYLELISNFKNNDSKDILNKIDAIIANPPYVRTQNIEDEKLDIWKNRFNLTGRTDMYHIFLAAMTENLEVGSYLCAITSNKYLNTSGGKSIRKLLDNNFEILEIIDLGDTKLFDASVLPAIFIGKKKKNNEKQGLSKFKRIYEYDKKREKDKKYIEIESIFKILEKENSGVYLDSESNKLYEYQKGNLTIPEKASGNWLMASDEDIEWSLNLKEEAKFLFSDLFEVKVGIKTTADKVFIKKDWTSLSDEMLPETELIKPLVTSKSFNSGKIDEDELLYILYPHYNKDGKREVIDLVKYPKAKNYLLSHKEQLSSRKYLKKANKKWYEIWVPHDPEAWGEKKVIFPDISSVPNFVIDTKGFLVDGNCYWIKLKENIEDDWLYLAVGVANSSIMQRYHDINFQNVLYSNKKRFMTQYVNNYLLPDINNKYSKEIINIVKEDIKVKTKSEEKKIEIDKLVKCAFNIN